MKIIHVARKPLAETSVALNCKNHGTGALNISATRVTTSDDLNGGAYAQDGKERWDGAENWRYKREGDAGEFVQPSGRWPGNLILQHPPGCRVVGSKQVGSGTRKTAVGGSSKPLDDGRGWNNHSMTRGGQTAPENYGAEQMTVWECVPRCPVADLDEISGERKTTWVSSDHANNRSGEFLGAMGHPGEQGYNDTGGASRFFKQVGGKTDDG
ncbi:hypothetical protein N9917_01490 [Deltaproteobacteria bacterium]|nr:hypothetical protein [Deltaproteobacteria bacterium]